MDVKLGDKQANLESIKNWTIKAAQKGVELICFPELCISGYMRSHSLPDLTPSQIGDKVWELSEPIPNGPSSIFLSKLASTYKVYILAGLPGRENDYVYNSYVIFGPDGFIGDYHKTHISTCEYPFYRGGYETPVFTLPKLVLGISTCYDCKFPELPRILALKGAELIIMPHTWPVEDPYDTRKRSLTANERRNELLKFVPCRAFENTAYVLYVDSVGTQSPTMHFPGVSMIVDPRGDLIAESKGSKETMIIANLKGKTIDKERSATYFTLRTRRPELYSELTKPK